MKILALTTAGAFLVAGSVIGTANMQAGTTNQVSAKTVSQMDHNSSEDINNLPESEVRNDQIDLADNKVVEDNAHKIDDRKKEGHQDENELEEDNSSKKTETKSDFLEHDILDEYVSSDGYQTQIVENNSHKRIIVLTDESGKPQYKSIFVKVTKSLEIIDLNQGMVFKGKIG